MTFKAFFTSDPGKAMIALGFSAILFVWPVAAGWLVASYTLSYAVDRLRRSFARLEEQEAAERQRQLEEDQQASSALQQLEHGLDNSQQGPHATQNHTLDRLVAGRNR